MHRQIYQISDIDSPRQGSRVNPPLRCRYAYPTNAVFHIQEKQHQPTPFRSMISLSGYTWSIECIFVENKYKCNYLTNLKEENHCQSELRRLSGCVWSVLPGNFRAFQMTMVLSTLQEANHTSWGDHATSITSGTGTHKHVGFWWQNTLEKVSFMCVCMRVCVCVHMCVYLQCGSLGSWHTATARRWPTYCWTRTRCWDRSTWKTNKHFDVIHRKNISSKSTPSACYNTHLIAEKECNSEPM